MEIIEKILSEKICSLIGLQPKLEGPNMGMFNGSECVSNKKEAFLIVPEIDLIASFEVNFDKDKALIVFALDGFEETATAKNLFED